MATRLVFTVARSGLATSPSSYSPVFHITGPWLEKKGRRPSSPTPETPSTASGMSSGTRICTGMGAKFGRVESAKLPAPDTKKRPASAPCSITFRKCARISPRFGIEKLIEYVSAPCWIAHSTASSIPVLLMTAAHRLPGAIPITTAESAISRPARNAAVRSPCVRPPGSGDGGAPRLSSPVSKLKPWTSSTRPSPSSSFPFSGISPGLVHSVARMTLGLNVQPKSCTTWSTPFPVRPSSDHTRSTPSRRVFHRTCAGSGRYGAL